MNQTVTITFGDQAENHKGMQMIGKLADSGFSFEDLYKAHKWFTKNGVETEIHYLNNPVDELKEESEEAYILIARNAVNAIVDADDFFTEMKELEWDKFALMYGRVVNKKARHNLCFDEKTQEADYKNGKGTIVAFDDVPLLKKVRSKLGKIVGDKAVELAAEGNNYYDILSTGISFHGDSERRRVIGVRLGASFPLHYQWYKNSEPVGYRQIFELNGGDIYIMSEKAVGTDWKSRTKYTLRHAAGSDKFIK